MRIEKAYTGYCVHQEEASQALQELEKNEKVKSWLEVNPLNFIIDRRNVNVGVWRKQKHGIFIPY